MSRNITPDNYDPNDPEQLQYVLDRRGLQYDLEAAGVSIYPEDKQSDDEGDGFQDLYSHTTALNGPGDPEDDESDDEDDADDADEEESDEPEDDEDEDEDEEEVDLNQMSVPELKEQLKARKLATGGNKEELIERLLESINSGE